MSENDFGPWGTLLYNLMILTMGIVFSAWIFVFAGYWIWTWLA